MDTGSRPRRIVAMGGGAFEADGTISLLDEHVIALTGRARPRVLFLPTASGDDRSYVTAFFDAYAPRAEAAWLPLFARRDRDLRARVLEQDAIVVGGGNTANMLAVWREHGVDTLLREAWEQGTVLAGVSAGAICWFGHGSTDSFGLQLEAFSAGLGFLEGSFCPHYDSEPLRRPRLRELLAEGLPAAWACDDGAAVVFEDTTFLEAVAARAEARAYRVERRDGEVVETELPTRYLGS